MQLALARVQEDSLDPLTEQHGLLRRSVSALATGVFRAARFTGLLGSAPSRESRSGYCGGAFGGVLRWKRAGVRVPLVVLPHLSLD